MELGFAEAKEIVMAFPLLARVADLRTALQQGAKLVSANRKRAAAAEQLPTLGYLQGELQVLAADTREAQSRARSVLVQSLEARGAWLAMDDLLVKAADFKRLDERHAAVWSKVFGVELSIDQARGWSQAVCADAGTQPLKTFHRETDGSRFMSLRRGLV